MEAQTLIKEYNNLGEKQKLLLDKLQEMKVSVFFERDQLQIFKNKEKIKR